MYKKIDADLKFADRELDVLKFWNDNRIFERSISQRENAPSFTFYDGPPTANGKPHIGHVLTRAVKDAVPRYKTMKGYKVLRKAGWDTHGLPVELEVERQLGMSGKSDIEAYGVEPFIKKCKESVFTYENEWREMSERVGFWADMDNPYVTYHNAYIESVWWSVKQIWEKGLLYRGHKVVPYCPRCGTALSSHEVAQGYKDVTETSVYVKFKVKHTDNEYFLAWTTTPWTLPSNVALVVNADVTYARVRCGNDIYILAEALAPKVLTGDYDILDTVSGAELAGISYEPLFDFAASEENVQKGFKICTDGYVTLTDGTGIVHTAPAFGEDDYRVGAFYGLPFVQLVDTAGKFTDEARLFAGMFVKDADPVIIEYLQDAKLLFKAEEYAHSYPFCWRCDTPLIYYARGAWFIKMTAVKDALLKNNDSVNWYPDNIKKGRFGNFLENVVDWGLSRERYWGTPLPVWLCECGYEHAIGSLAELKQTGNNVPDEIELHKPYVDAIEIVCPRCGGTMRRTPEVIDCWYDSGAMPFAQWHYPFENADLFDENFPADFISEAVDQTRGWFYSLIAISTVVFGRSPYKNCIVLGHVLDADGEKMSKHKNNVIDPWTVLDNQGADAVRWYFYVSSAPWLPSRFSAEAVSEAQRKFMGTFWNTCAFYTLYASIDGFDPTHHEKSEREHLPLMDRWILSKLNTLIQYVDSCMEHYKLTEAARALTDFTDELSNWYVRRCRDRYWAPGMERDKTDAYMTLYEALSALAKLAAPFVPFIAEDAYRHIVTCVDQNAPPSVHLCDYPKPDERFIDTPLERGMDRALQIVTLGRAARNAAGIKNRQPVSCMYVRDENGAASFSDEINGVITEELNVKRIIYTDDVQNYTAYTIKPQLKTAGPKYGKLLPSIAAYLRSGDGNAFAAELNATGAVSFNIGAERISLTEAELIIESDKKDGFSAESDRGITVVIDTVLTDELIEEGYVREIVSKIQTMRKEAGFDVTDRIHVTYEEADGAVLAGVLGRNAAEIQKDVLADTLSASAVAGHVKRWNINGRELTIGVKNI